MEEEVINLNPPANWFSYQPACRSVFDLSLPDDGDWRRVPRPLVGSGRLWSPSQRSICNQRCKFHFGRLQRPYVVDRAPPRLDHEVVGPFLRRADR